MNVAVSQWVYFSFQQENAPDMVYLGSLTNFDLIYAWTQDKCVPLVREITFENGEVRIFYTILLLGFLSQNQSVSFKVSNPRQRTFCMLCFHRKYLSDNVFSFFWSFLVRLEIHWRQTGSSFVHCQNKKLQSHIEIA